MKIEWTNSDGYYHVELDGTFDKKEAVKQLILKILELSSNRKSWNLIVLDTWIFNLGRLIGNIQNTDEAIGMDRDYRVAIQFLDYYDRLENSEDDDEDYAENLGTIQYEIEEVIINVIHEENFKSQLMTYYNINPFTIEISEQGQRVGTTFQIT